MLARDIIVLVLNFEFGMVGDFHERAEVYIVMILLY
jgi:hypothetical protein